MQNRSTAPHYVLRTVPGAFRLRSVRFPPPGWLQCTQWPHPASPGISFESLQATQRDPDRHQGLLSPSLEISSTMGHLRFTPSPHPSTCFASFCLISYPWVFLGTGDPEYRESFVTRGSHTAQRGPVVRHTPFPARLAPAGRSAASVPPVAGRQQDHRGCPCLPMLALSPQRSGGQQGGGPKCPRWLRTMCL